MPANVARVSGALGLLLLVTSPLTWLFTASSATPALVKTSLGALLVGVFLSRHLGSAGARTTSRAALHFGKSGASILLLLGVLIGLNVVAERHAPRVDLTDQGIFTLAPQTREVLARLDAPVEAIGFVRSEHPYYALIQELLERYHREAPERFGYRFEDPARNPAMAERYELREGQTTVILTRRSGADESHTRLDVLSEQALTNALVQLEARTQRTVYFTAGHGEWTLDAPTSDERQGLGISELATHLRQEGYAPESINLAGKRALPDDAALLIVAGPRVSLTAPEVEAISRYVDDGGRLLVFVEPGTRTGLEGLLESLGLSLDEGVVADDEYGVGSPYVVLSLFFGAHEIVEPLAERQLNVELPTARGLTLARERPEGVTLETLVTTSSHAWGETYPDDAPERSDGEKSGQIALAVAVTKKLGSGEAPEGSDGAEAKVVVFGDSELLVDANWGHEGNRNLVLNSLAWASNQLERITIRPPDRAVSTLEIEPAALDRIRLVIADLLPMTLLGMGLAVWISRRGR